ncbi:MAG: hypothetical protein R2857_15330 [Vampirovibrionales bacterium]
MPCCCLQATNMGLGLIKGWGNDNRIKADVLRQRLPQEPNLQIVVAPQFYKRTQGAAPGRSVSA